MSVPAQAGSSGTWTEEDWGRALDARPDLFARLHAGDATAIAEMLELHPGVAVRSVRVHD